MALSVGDIATQAFDAAAEEFTGVIKSCTLRRKVVGDYDTQLGTATTSNTDATCRAVFAGADAADDAFPELEVSPLDDVVYLQGVSVGFVPREADLLIVSGGATWQLRAVRDVVQGGGLYAAVVQPT